MLPAEPSKLTLAQKRAAIARSVQLGDRQAADEARREYACAKIENFVRRTVDAAPPLSAEQRERLAALLRPHSGGGPGAVA